MGILDHLKKLEDRIEALFDRETPGSAAETEGSSPETGAIRQLEPVELKRAVLDAVEAEIRRIDGRPAFPFNRLELLLWAPEPKVQAILEAELFDDARLEREVLRTLETAGVVPDRRLALVPRFLGPEDEIPPVMRRQGFLLECLRERETEKMDAGGSPRARLVVERGEAEVAELELTRPRINLGRLQEVLDDRDRVVRRNDLAFKDVPGINATVSRVHAHIRFDQGSGEHRLFDDHSAEGTVLFRDGRRIDVPRGQRRGIPLRDGDEIYLGQARLRFARR